MREVIQKEKSIYQKYIGDEIKRLLGRMSKGVKVPPLQPRSKKRRSQVEGPTLRNETGINFSVECPVLKMEDRPKHAESQAS